VPLLLLLLVISCIFFLIYLFYFFFGNTVLQLHTHTFSLTYCVSFSVVLDGVCLLRNKGITYLLTYFAVKLCKYARSCYYMVF